MESDRVPKKYFRAFEAFVKSQVFGGVLLLVSAICALYLANSSVSSGFYAQAVSFLQHDVNAGLMPFFFLLVGLEIKREMRQGELKGFRKSLLPIVGALGGMIVPALIFVGCNRQDPGHWRGFGIPMATDIAFALGVLSLLGSRIPRELRIFLSAVAIVDDLGAVLVIAFFYSRHLMLGYLAGAVCVLGILILLNHKGVKSLWIYGLLGIGLWFLILKSGVHPTVAGVLLAFCIPLDQVRRIEHGLNSPVAYGVLPLFAFLNAGVVWGVGAAGGHINSIMVGVIAGLVLGKVVGIVGASWLCVRLRWAQLPEQLSWGWLFAVSWVAGIGFTMAFFISDLAFVHPDRIASAKLGILIASLLAGILGFFALFIRARLVYDATES